MNQSVTPQGDGRESREGPHYRKTLNLVQIPYYASRTRRAQMTAAAKRLGITRQEWVDRLVGAALRRGKDSNAS